MFVIIKIQVDSLLVSFCQDAGISLDEAIRGVQKLEQIPDLKEVFQVSINVNVVIQ